MLGNGPSASSHLQGPEGVLPRVHHFQARWSAVLPLGFFFLLSFGFNKRKKFKSLFQMEVLRKGTQQEHLENFQSTMPLPPVEQLC